MRLPERNAGIDTLVGQEDLAVLVPRNYALGRPGHRIQDRLVDGGPVENGRQGGSIEAVVGDHPVDEMTARLRDGFSVVGVRRDGRTRPSATAANADSPEETSSAAECHGASNFLWL